MSSIANELSEAVSINNLALSSSVETDVLFEHETKHNKLITNDICKIIFPGLFLISPSLIDVEYTAFFEKEG